MLSGDLTVLQASMLHGPTFDPFAVFDDGSGPAEASVGLGSFIAAEEHAVADRATPRLSDEVLSAKPEPSHGVIRIGFRRFVELGEISSPRQYSGQDQRRR